MNIILTFILLTLAFIIYKSPKIKHNTFKSILVVLISFLPYNLFACVIPLLIGGFIYFSFVAKFGFKKNIKKLEHSFEFENIYRILYSNNRHTSENLRIKTKWLLVIEISTPFILYFSSIFFPNFFVISLILLAILVTNIDKKRKAFYSEYKLIYKNNLIKQFIPLVNKNLSYSLEDNLITENDYLQANFNNFPSHILLFMKNDLIHGFLTNEISITMCNLYTKYMLRKSRSRFSKKSFSGIFGYITSNKNIGADIKIIKNQTKIKKNSHFVELDSSEFETYFDVHSENKILAVRLLTSEVMQMLIDFYAKYELDFEFILKNDKIYFRFFTSSMFEPKIFDNSMNKEVLWIYYSVIKFIIDITEKITNVSKDLEI